MKIIRSYRGKSKQDGEWIYGDLIHLDIDDENNPIKLGIQPFKSPCIEVDPKTVGRYARKNNFTDDVLYEYDIIYFHYDEYNYIGVVNKYGNVDFRMHCPDFCPSSREHYEQHRNSSKQARTHMKRLHSRYNIIIPYTNPKYGDFDLHYTELLGNIFDNCEFLEEVKKGKYNG